MHYVNSRVVGLPPLGCETAERKRPLSIDACRSPMALGPGFVAVPQMVCLQPPASPPGQAEIVMAANGDINYRSIRVEEPNEYHTPNAVPLVERQVSEPQPLPVVNGGSASSGTIRSSLSSNGDSSLTSMSGSTGSPLSSVGFSMANGSKPLLATVNGRPLMTVAEPSPAPKMNSEYAARSYDRL